LSGDVPGSVLGLQGFVGIGSMKIHRVLPPFAADKFGSSKQKGVFSGIFSGNKTPLS
jgi:hypothetical protein